MRLTLALVTLGLLCVTLVAARGGGGRGSGGPMKRFLQNKGRPNNGPQGGQPNGKGGKGGKGKDGKGKGGKGDGERQRFQDDPEKAFFCFLARHTCKLQAGNEEPLVDQQCLNGAPCNGITGKTYLNGTTYSFTLCMKKPDERPDPVERLLTMASKGKPTGKLAEICTPPNKAKGTEGKGTRPRPPNPFWYHMSCKVETTTASVEGKERDCHGERACDKGPYDMELNGTTVQAYFCNREPREGVDNEGEKKKMNLLAKLACEVRNSTGLVFKKDCPGEQSCTVRVTDAQFEGDSETYQASFCDGSRMGKGKGFMKKMIQKGKKIMKGKMKNFGKKLVGRFNKGKQPGKQPQRPQPKKDGQGSRPSLKGKPFPFPSRPSSGRLRSMMSKVKQHFSKRFFGRRN